MPHHKDLPGPACVAVALGAFYEKVPSFWRGPQQSGIVVAKVSGVAVGQMFGEDWTITDWGESGNRTILKPKPNFLTYPCGACTFQKLSKTAGAWKMSRASRATFFA
jgi:hypothetical protein